MASAWTLIAGVGTDVEEATEVSNLIDVSDAVVTMLPAGTAAEPDPEVPAAEAEPAPVEQTDETAAETEPAPAPAAAETAYVWPVYGAVSAPYAVETLRYDATMADWRTHDGVDIACALGDEVIAAGNGTVARVYSDDLYGTTVEIDHENGVRSVYANLAAEPPVWEGQTVTMGQTIGSVGGTALGETNEVPHLHFAMTVDGVSRDPGELLPPLAEE